MAKKKKRSPYLINRLEATTYQIDEEMPKNEQEEIKEYRKIEKLENEYSEEVSKRKTEYAIAVVGFGLVLLVVVNIFTGVTNYIACQEALSVAKEGFPGSGLPKYEQILQEELADFRTVHDEVKAGSTNWEVKRRTGDGDKTPKTYYWVKASTPVDVYRKAGFDNKSVKLFDTKISYGPYLVDTEKKIFAKSFNSDGSGWQDFWNVEEPVYWESYE